MDTVPYTYKKKRSLFSSSDFWIGREAGMQNGWKGPSTPVWDIYHSYRSNEIIM